MSKPTHLRPSRHASVAVVIPAYNCASTIVRALDSVARQTLQTECIIVVDDASLDESVDVVEAYIRQNPDLPILLHRSAINQGAGQSRNTGWELARTDYVAFLDADDSWHPDKLRVQHEWMQAHPDVCLSGHTHVLCTRSEVPWCNLEGQTPHATSVTRMRMLLGNPFITPSVMLHRSCPLRFASGKRHMEDHLLWMQIALSGYRVDRIESPLAAIHKHPWGAAGLSAQLWPMQKAELDNLSMLRQSGWVNRLEWFFLCAWSLAKFSRRLLIQASRRLIE